MFGKTNWVLKGVRGAHAHAIYVLESDVILGRSSDADIQILDQRVSRQHARLVVSRDEVTLEDLGSHNGTYVHGLKIHRRPLRVGDRLRVGVSEYVFDQIKGRVLTSAIFLNKLTNKDTMGATAVTSNRTPQRKILSSETADMPAVRESQEVAARSEERVAQPAPEPAPKPPHTRRPEPRTASPERSEPAYVREQRERAVRLPTPLPGELNWSANTSDPAPSPSGSAPLPDARRPPDEAPRRAEADVSGLNMDEVETVPLDPRTQRVHTPLPDSLPPLTPDPILPGTPIPPPPEANLPTTAPDPPPAEDPPEEADPEDAGLDAALRTIDAVVRLLKLRAQETGGALLKIQDRENLRKLEGVLRESRRKKNNRRRWSRLPCQLLAHVGDEDGDALVTDIGAGGLRVAGSSIPVLPGDMISVRVHLGEGRLARIAVFQTKIAWVDKANDTFGAIFAGPAHWELAA